PLQPAPGGLRRGAGGAHPRAGGPGAGARAPVRRGRGPRVHQLLSGAGPYDAITNQALAWRRILEGWGWAGEVAADSRDPAVGPAVRDAAGLAGRMAPDDALVIHYSAYAPGLEEALALPQRKLLVYHNITPARYLWEHEPYVALA